VDVVGRDIYKEMGDCVYCQDATCHVPPVPGALDAIARLRADHEFVLVTARTGERSGFAQEWLAKWDETRGIGVLGIKTSLVSKLEVCREHGIDVLIDDDERHFRDADTAQTMSILFKQDAPAELSYPVRVCRTWAEIADVIEAAAVVGR
jgi:hypothetical protein